DVATSQVLLDRAALELERVRRLAALGRREVGPGRAQALAVVRERIGELAAQRAGERSLGGEPGERSLGEARGAIERERRGGAPGRPDRVLGRARGVAGGLPVRGEDLRLAVRALVGLGKRDVELALLTGVGMTEHGVPD